MSGASFERVGRRDDGARDFGEFDALVHCALAQVGVGGVFRDLLLIHQQAFGAIDQLAFGEFVFDLREAFAQLRFLRESCEGDFEDRRQSFRGEPFDEVGRDARADRVADQLLVRVVTEHQHRTWRGGVHHRELFERVARRRFRIDDDDVGPLALNHAMQRLRRRRAGQHLVAESCEGIAQIAYRLVGIGYEENTQHGVWFIDGWLLDKATCMPVRDDYAEGNAIMGLQIV